MATCDSCRRRRTESWYQFHYGTLEHVQPGYHQTIYGYTGIMSDGATICGWCAPRHLLLRYILPLCAVIVLELAAYYELSVGPLRLTENGVYISTVVILLMLSVLGSGLWYGIAHSVVLRGHWRGIRLFFSGLILFVGTFGIMWPMVWWLDQASSGKPVQKSVGAPADWFIGIPVCAQILLLLFLVNGRSVPLETKAWRLKRKRLRGGESVMRTKVTGWNSVQFAGMNRTETDG